MFWFCTIPVEQQNLMVSKSIFPYFLQSKKPSTSQGQLISSATTVPLVLAFLLQQDMMPSLPCVFSFVRSLKGNFPGEKWKFVFRELMLFEGTDSCIQKLVRNGDIELSTGFLLILHGFLWIPYCRYICSRYGIWTPWWLQNEPGFCWKDWSCYMTTVQTLKTLGFLALWTPWLGDAVTWRDNHTPLKKENNFKKALALLQVILYEAFSGTGQERVAFNRCLLWTTWFEVNRNPESYGAIVWRHQNIYLLIMHVVSFWNFGT